MKWVQVLAVIAATVSFAGAQVVDGSGSSGLLGSVQPIRACQNRLYGCAIFDVRATCDPHPNCTWVNRQCQNNTAIQCLMLTSESTCGLIDSCEWKSDMGDSFCSEAACGDRQSPQSCNTFYCSWNGTHCEDELPGNYGSGSGLVGPSDEPPSDVPPIFTSGSGVGSGPGSGITDPTGEPSRTFCQGFSNATACDSDSQCAWTPFDESGSGGNTGSGGIDGYQGFCSEILCQSFMNESSCNAFNGNQCLWQGDVCFDNFLVLIPDASSCFRIVDATTCNATAGCVYDNVTTRGHCRGPCDTQRDYSYCSIGCLRAFEGERPCIDESEADCILFNEDSCPSSRCSFRETYFACPFLTCGRGSPCAERHVCSTEGFHSAQCCTAMQQYCNSTMGDMACTDTAVINEMQDRFNCTISSEEVQIGSLCHDRVQDEATCNSISGCAWRAFEYGSGLEGSGFGSGAPSGFCDDIYCSDFNNQTACNSNNCTFDDESDMCMENVPIDPSLGSGSGIPNEGSGVGSGLSSGIGPITPGIEPTGSGSVFTGCSSHYTQDACPEDCEWIEETISVPGSGSGSALENSTQTYCVEPGCWTQQTEAGCNAQTSCTWNFGFCTETPPIDVVPTNPQLDCIYQNSTSCTALEECNWDETLQFCNPFTCSIITTESECISNDACEWFVSAGSGALDISYCIDSIDDGPSSTVMSTQAADCSFYYGEFECNGATNCTWFADFCSPISCRTQSTESSCTGLDAQCVWYESTYDGFVCGNTSEVINVDPVELVDCNRFNSRSRCISRNFCTWLDGGPGCKERDATSCEAEAPECYEYTDFVMCNADPNCYFSSVDGNFFCTEQTTPQPPTEPPLPPVQRLCPQERPLWHPGTEYYPGIYLGRVGLFTCSQVYTQAPLRDLTTEQILSDLRANCCSEPTAAPSTTQPTPTPTDVGVTTPPPSAPTAAPTVEGGTDITITFGTAILRRFNNVQKLSFEFQVENAVSTLAGIPRRRILRISLQNNPGGAGMIAKVFFDGSVSLLTAANVQAGIVNSPIAIVIEGTNNAAGSYRSGAVVVDSRTFRPTPSPVTIAPTFPSGTRAPVAAPIIPVNAAGSSDDDDKSIEDNLMIIIIVVSVIIVALIAFVVYTRSKRSSGPGMIRPPHHSNPVYQTAPAPGNGMGPAAPANGPGGAQKGMVRVESMC